MSVVPRTQDPIGIFDSGVGGLTVLDALRRLLPDERYLYLGDTAHLPYGTKSAHRIGEEALAAAGFLVGHGIKLLVVACNTATAAALDRLERTFAPLPTVGVIRPGAELAVRNSRTGSIALLATEATIRSGAYPRALASLCPTIRCTPQAAPILVALAEEGWFTGGEAEGVLRRYLDPLFAVPAARPDCLLLGCTHFPPFSPLLSRLVPSGTPIVDSAGTTAVAVAEMLRQRGLLATGADGESGLGAEPQYYVTDNPERFLRIAPHFLSPAPDAVFLVADLMARSGTAASMRVVHPAHPEPRQDEGQEDPQTPADGAG